MTVVNVVPAVVALATGSALTSGTFSAVPWGATGPATVTTGPKVVFPQPITVPVSITGPSTPIDLIPGDGSWCWAVTITVGSQSVTRYVAVPASGPVDWASLVDVDPSTLAPVAPDAVAMWTVAYNAAMTALAAAQAVGNTNDAIMAGVAADSGSEFAAQLAATTVRIIPALELAPLFASGHSFVSGSSEALAGSSWVNRVQSRFRMQPLVNYGHNGGKTDVIMTDALSLWTPGTRGLVLLMVLMNDVQFNGASSLGPGMAQDNVRTMLTWFSAGAFLPETAACFGLGGSAWGTITGLEYKGSSAYRTTTVGDYVDVAWNGDGCAILTRFDTASTAGTVQVLASGSQAVLKTVSLGSRLTAVPGVIPLTGFGPGDHSVRLRLSAGAGFTVDGIILSNPNPPTIVLLREGPVKGFFTGPFFSDVAAGNAALVNVFGPALDSVAAEFPNVLLGRNGGPADWDADAMCSADKLHPNPMGSVSYANEVSRLLGTPGWREGLDPLGGTFVPTVVTPTYIPGSAAVPAAPIAPRVTRIDGGFQLDWVAGSNGGSPITDYLVEYKLGAGSWTAYAHTASAATTAAISVATTDTFTARVSAINAVGTGAASNEASIVTYAFDDFNRADSTTVGSATPGGAWNPYLTSVANPNWAIANNKLAGTNTTASGILYVDDGAADGVLKLTIPTGATQSDLGLAFRVASGTSFWMLWTGGAGFNAAYKLMKYTGTFTTVKTSTIIVAPGDKLEVRLNGAAIDCYINGVQAFTPASDSFNQLVTKHGVRVNNASNTVVVDDFAHTSG